MSDPIDLTNIIDDDHTPTLIIEDRWITHIQHTIDEALHHAVTQSEFLLFSDTPILRHDTDLIRSLHHVTRYGLTCGLHEIAAYHDNHVVPPAEILVAYPEATCDTHNAESTQLVASPYYNPQHPPIDDLVVLTEIIIHIPDDQPIYVFQTLTSTFEHSLDDILQSESLTGALHNYLCTNTHLPGTALGQLRQH